MDHSTIHAVTANTEAPETPAPTAQPPASTPAEAHQAAAGDIAPHARAILEAFELEVAAHGAGEEGAEEDAGDQGEIEGQDRRRAATAHTSARRRTAR